MTIEKTIKKAIEGGYKNDSKVDYRKWDLSSVYLDPSFWQSLGKALGWEGDDEDTFGEWTNRWRKFIDYLIWGRTAEEYFKEL